MSEPTINVGATTTSHTTPALALEDGEEALECAHCRTFKRASPDAKRSAFWKNKTRSTGYAETCKGCNKILRGARRAGKLPCETTPDAILDQYTSDDGVLSGPAKLNPWRNEKGQLIKGHPGINTYRQRTGYRRWLDVINENCSYEDMVLIVQKAVTQACNGSRYARDWLWSYGIGKPLQMIEVSSTTSPILTIFAAWLKEFRQDTDEQKL